MFERIFHMVIKEFIQIFRDPRVMGIILVVPMIQSLIFGYAVTTDVKNIATAVLDQDLTPASRNLIQSFEQSRYFIVDHHLQEEKEINTVLDSGAALAVVHIRPGFQAKLETGQSAPIQALVDGTNANTAGIVASYIGNLVQQQSYELFLERLKERPSEINPHFGVTLQSRTWFNENLKSRNFYVPGIIATILTLLTLTLTSMAIVREKEIGTIEQIMVSPITQGEFIMGKTLPFIAVGFFDVIATLLVAVFWFEVPLRGSLLLLLGCAGLYLMTTLGLGLLISTISQTQQQALLSTLLFYLPTVLLSGFIFPIENMPEAIRWVTYLNPLRYFLVIIRGIFLKGVGIDILWPQIGVLAIMGVFILWLATSRFHKTLA